MFTDSEMDTDSIIVKLSVVGAVVALVSFLIYIFNPNMAFVYLFAIGAGLFIGGYVYAGVRIRRMNKRIAALEEELENRQEGAIISLDEPYVPEGDYATIETLE